jgi:hypothetical protein
MIRSLLLFAPFAAVFACAGEKPQEPAPGPRLPPLVLRPFLPEMKAMAARLEPPAEAVQKELRELAEVALHLVEADARTQTRAERALLEHRDAWWALEPALQHTEPSVRQRAAWLCGQSGRTILQLPLLLRLKYDKDPMTVVWVADALQRLGNDTGLAWLEGALGREATAQKAGELAIEALKARGIALAEQPTWDAIRAELQKLYQRWQQQGTTSLPVSAPDAVELETRLAAHLITPEGWQLRPVDDARYVLRNAGGLGVPMLCRALVTDLHYIRTMPLQVLAELGPAASSAADAVLPLVGDAKSSAYAVRALGEIGAAQHAPFLRPLLADADSELRAAAAQALGLLRDEASREPLRQRLRDGNETLDVRVNAAFGLRCFGEDAEAEAFLADRAQKGDYHTPMLERLRERLAAAPTAAR